MADKDNKNRFIGYYFHEMKVFVRIIKSLFLDKIQTPIHLKNICQQVFMKLSK